MKHSLLLNYIICSILFYIAIFFFYTYPLLTNFSSAVSGSNGGDSAQYLWNSFIFKQELLQGRNPFYTDYTFYPLGANLFFHTYTPIISVFSLPFENLYLATNLMLLIQFVVSGLGAFLLCYKLCKHPAWSLLVGFIFAFSPYKMAHFTEHFHLMLTATIPFYIIACINAIDFDKQTFIPRIQSYSALYWSLFLLILTFFSDYYATCYLLLFTSLYLAFPWTYAFALKLKPLKRWGIIGGILLISHIIINQLVRHNVNDNAAFWWQPDWANFVVPSFISNYFNTAFFYKHFYSSGLSVELPIFLGWSFLLMLSFAVYTFYVRRKPSLSTVSPFYVFIALFFIGMTVPELRILGKGIFYMPTGFYYLTPFFNNIRIPGRASLMVYLFLPIVLAYLWIYSKEKITPWLYKWAPVACLIVLFFEFTPHAYPMQNRQEQMSINNWLKQQPGTVMLSFPFGLMDGFDKLGMPKTESLIDQTVHQKKLLGGYVSRLKPETFDYYKKDSVCKILFALEAKNDSIEVKLIDKKYTEDFLSHFKPDLIYLPKEYKHSSLQHFIELNFTPYIQATDSIADHTVYRFKSARIL